jgi:hypothetical protein
MTASLPEHPIHKGGAMISPYSIGHGQAVFGQPRQARMRQDGGSSPAAPPRVVGKSRLRIGQGGSDSDFSATAGSAPRA